MLTGTGGAGQDLTGWGHRMRLVTTARGERGVEHLFRRDEVSSEDGERRSTATFLAVAAVKRGAPLNPRRLPKLPIEHGRSFSAAIEGSGVIGRDAEPRDENEDRDGPGEKRSDGGSERMEVAVESREIAGER